MICLRAVCHAPGMTPCSVRKLLPLHLSVPSMGRTLAPTGGKNGGHVNSNTLNLLSVGDRVWVKDPGFGFVGVGEVTGPREPITEFRIATEQGERPAIEVLNGGTYHREFIDDPDRMEYFLPVRWLHSVPLDQGVNEIGMFGNQNTVCKPTTPKWRTTVERLKERWGGVILT